MPNPLDPPTDLESAIGPPGQFPDEAETDFGYLAEEIAFDYNWLDLVSGRGSTAVTAINRKKLASRIYAALTAAMREGAEQMREAAARTVEDGQETVTSTHSGDVRFLSPRKPGNLMGVAYSEAIRRLPLPETT